VFATALSARMTVEDLEHLDLAYAPPFGSAADPVITAGQVAANVSRGEFVSVTPDELKEEPGSGHQIVDVRTPHERARGVIHGAVDVGVDEVRARLGELDPGKRTVFYCATGYRSYLAVRVAGSRGFERAESLSGGTVTWRSSGRDLTREERGPAPEGRARGPRS
jgi:rhodanese-related sulfurtransferase